MDPKLITRCRDRLIEVSRQRGTITYSELAAHMGVANQAVGQYLNAVYNDLVVKSGLPDLTLLAVYSGTRYGRYNSRGRLAQSVKFDQNNEDHRRIYDSDRELVYRHWA